MAIQVLSPVAVTVKEPGWDFYSDADILGTLTDDSDASGIVARWSSAPNDPSALRLAVQPLGPVFAIQDVTLLVHIYRTGGTYTGAQFRPVLWIRSDPSTPASGAPYYVAPSSWLSPADEAELDEGDGWVRAPFGLPALVAAVSFGPTNPATGSPWTREDLNTIEIGCLARNLDDTFFTAPKLALLRLQVSTTGAPDQLEQARDVVSRYEWRHRAPVREIKSIPVRQSLGLGLRPMQVLKVAHFAGPHEEGQGWKARPWQLRHFQAREIELRDDGTTIISGPERRELRVLFYTSAWPKDNASPATEDGVLKIGKGVTETYTRTGQAWAQDPGSDLFTLVAANEKPFGKYGLECFGAYLNDLPFSAFQSGSVDGWALTDGGDGTTLAADLLGVDGSDLGETQGWDPDSTGVRQSLLGIVGSPHSATAATYRTSNPTLTYPPHTILSASVWFTIYVTGQSPFVALKRQVDGYFYDFDGRLWQPGVSWRRLTDSSRDGTAQGETGGVQSWNESGIDIGDAPTTVTMRLGFDPGGVSDLQANRWYAAQITPGFLCGAPAILTFADPVTRNAGVWRISNTLGKRCINLAQGALSLRFFPAWRGDEQPAGTIHTLAYVRYDDDNSLLLRHQTNVDGLTGLLFQVRASGTTYECRLPVNPVNLVPAAGYKVTARWTGPQGELGLPPHTASLFLGGPAIGTTLKSADATFTPPTETDESYLEIGSALGSNHLDGWVREIRSSQWVPTDAEAMRLP